MIIVYLGLAGIMGTAYSTIVYPNYWSFDNYEPNYMMDPMDWVLQIPFTIFIYVVAIYLIRKWSRKWNEEFNSMNQ